MKKAIYFVSIIILIFIGYSWYYVNQYHIEDNRTAIQSNLTEWSSRGSGSIHPDVIEVVQLDDTSSYIVLFQTQSSHMGYAHMIKGWNGKFKITHSGHGTNIVKYQKIQTNKGMYGIIVGKNPDLKIDHIIADLYDGDFSFSSNVRADEKFVRYEKIPNDIEEPFPAELTFYDKEGSVIKK
ncbi:hypothetical protein BN1058_00519 [Paraliobacillus sp. PM-2]|uniref:hypothetical protein n=1 Tax=Paraliobacillus sp. PM-2 TaxID=1462524 RepID=UPI00061B8B21|nr:hypothetical protein [Paraliobacillus sp. PM-2]CQR46266.1 hypothetical protein BN1058_00519 [Paraliobacillus sp. PM-2]